MEIKENFKGKRILTIGDVMLDQDEYFLVKRISPEAPIPILEETGHTEERLGGAANVAANLESLGAQTTLAGVIGDDDVGQIFTDLLRETSINRLIVTDIFNRKTTRKKRLLASSKSHPTYQVARIDRESTEEIHYGATKYLEKGIFTIMNEIDAVIFSDYDKGVLTPVLLDSLAKNKRFKETPIIVDTKQQKIKNYGGFYSTWYTPNIKEAEEITGIKYTSAKDEETLRTMGTIFQEKTNTSTTILFTLGEDGMALYNNGKVDYLPAKKIENPDVAGAGDTVNATLALSLASGYSPLKSAKLANYAASIVVGKKGTATCSVDELEKLVQNV